MGKSYVVYKVNSVCEYCYLQRENSVIVERFFTEDKWILIVSVYFELYDINKSFLDKVTECFETEFDHEPSVEEAMVVMSQIQPFISTIKEKYSGYTD